MKEFVVSLDFEDEGKVQVTFSGETVEGLLLAVMAFATKPELLQTIIGGILENIEEEQKDVTEQ